jgi:hypothetical protein
MSSGNSHSTDATSESHSKWNLVRPGCQLLTTKPEVSELTVMIRKLPRGLTQDRLCNLVWKIEPLRGSFDLIYLPLCNGKTCLNRGYAFINFIDLQKANLFLLLLACGNVPDDIESCIAVWAHIQGKFDMLEHLRVTSNTKRNVLSSPALFDRQLIQTSGRQNF